MKSSETCTCTSLFLSGAVLALRILTVSYIMVSLLFQTSSTLPLFPSCFVCFCFIFIFLHGHVSLLMQCRGEWNNTIKRWWKRPEYFPPNLVFTAHSSQKASCLFLFGWQIIQSERGQAGCDTAGSRAEKYGDRLAAPCPPCFMWLASCALAWSAGWLVAMEHKWGDLRPDRWVTDSFAVGTGAFRLHLLL